MGKHDTTSSAQAAKPEKPGGGRGGGAPNQVGPSRGRPVDRGRPCSLAGNVFKEMGEMFPQVEPLRQLRHTLSQLRLSDLAIGDDGRNRCMIGQFVASSGRNAPKASQYIFGPSTWLRGLIKPEPGRALAYIDWSSQEIGIAAALSGDANLLEAATSGDPYIYFAKMANLVPEDATKDSHKAVREMCKRCMLGVNYGMRAMSLSFRISKSVMEAQDLLQRHRQVFPRFWAWSDGAVRVATLFGHIDLTFGWRVHDGPDTSPLSLQNAPMQGNAAEMMRLAAIAGVRRGVQIDAVIHDAFLIESDADQLEDAVATMQAAMAFASNKVLGGLELKTDVNRVCWPDRYMDSRPAAKCDVGPRDGDLGRGGGGGEVVSPAVADAQGVTPVHAPKVHARTCGGARPPRATRVQYSSFLVIVY